MEELTGNAMMIMLCVPWLGFVLDELVERGGGCRPFKFCLVFENIYLSLIHIGITLSTQFLNSFSAKKNS